MHDNLRRVDGVLKTEPGPFLARVVRHIDGTYSGMLDVEVLHESFIRETDPAGKIRRVRYLNPFYGTTPAVKTTDSTQTYDNTQKSYGMWMVPPDVGALVVVLFIQGKPELGFWVGCVQENEFSNFMIPGVAATKFVDSTDTEFPRVPAAEYNPNVPSVNVNKADPTKTLKPVHPFTKILKIQGLLKDDIRGITTSSARRETPSAVFGFSTPGPLDKQQGAPSSVLPGSTSRKFTSRLGGSSFVCDDGDDRFLRKTDPASGPPVYSSVEQQETPVDPTAVTRPHNELIRIRTRTGHQILLHNSEDLIYIGNSRGTAWIELTSDGKIDVFANDSVSFRTNADFNFSAGRDVNIEGKRNVNIKAGGKIHAQSTSSLSFVAGSDLKITAKANIEVASSQNVRLSSKKKTEINSTMDVLITSGASTQLLSTGSHLITAAIIGLNGAPAQPATPATEASELKVNTLPTNDGKTLSSIMNRVPTAEPYPHHENLDPLKFKPEKTDRDAPSISTPAQAWKEYTTNYDTFEKLKRG